MLCIVSVHLSIITINDRSKRVQLSHLPFFRIASKSMSHSNGNCSVHLVALIVSEFVHSIQVNDFEMNLSCNYEAKNLLFRMEIFSHDADRTRRDGCWRRECSSRCDLERLY